MAVVYQVVLLVMGFVMLIKGADWFVEGASSVAKAMKIPSLVIGLTLVSIGTSMPEFSVSLTSSIKGFNDISFGNIIGSNIFNVLVVIGISSIFAPMVMSKNVQKYDIPFLLGIYLLLMLFAFIISILVSSEKNTQTNISFTYFRSFIIFPADAESTSNFFRISSVNLIYATLFFVISRFWYI